MDFQTPPHFLSIVESRCFPYNMLFHQNDPPGLVPRAHLFEKMLAFLWPRKACLLNRRVSQRSRAFHKSTQKGVTIVYKTPENLLSIYFAFWVYFCFARFVFLCPSDENTLSNKQQLDNVKVILQGKRQKISSTDCQGQWNDTTRPTETTRRPFESTPFQNTANASAILTCITAAQHINSIFPRKRDLGTPKTLSRESRKIPGNSGCPTK